MRYFLDCEFIEKGRTAPIELISIGIVCEDGRQLYRINEDANLWAAGDWVKQHVLPQLYRPDRGHADNASIDAIVKDVLKFVGQDMEPEFWAYYADYDWVVFCQLFGTMMDLPSGWPMYCRDLKQVADELGNPVMAKSQENEHNALDDALWDRDFFDFLCDYERRYPGKRQLQSIRL